MRVIPELEQEFEELCREYSISKDPQGRDVVALVRLFGDTNDNLDDRSDPDVLGMAWRIFLKEHGHQTTVYPMVGLMLYLLVTYWPQGQLLLRGLPELEKLLLRDVVMEMSEEIAHRSMMNIGVVIPFGGDMPDFVAGAD